MKDLNNLIAYYRACYQADNRERSINDYWGNKVSHQYLLPSAELLQGSLERLIITNGKVEKLFQQFKLHKKEKELVCLSFFLIHPNSRSQKSQVTCIPLFIHTAKLGISGNVHFLELADNFSYINPEIVDYLDPVDPEIEVLKHLNQKLPSGLIGPAEATSIAELFEEDFRNIDTQYVDQFPFVLVEEELKDLMAQCLEDKVSRLVPCIGLGLIKKSTLSRGILNELEALSKAKSFSRPLLELFQKKNSYSDWGWKKSMHYVPASLSKAQTGILDGINTTNLNLVIGPPGTGKSFTIATIAIDAVSTGRSVLIASKTNQAVDVIANKLEQDFDLADMVVRGGKSSYKKRLQKRLDNLLNGIGLSVPEKNSLKKLALMIEREAITIRKLRKKLVKQEKSELKWGEFISEYKENFFSRIYRNWIQRSLKSNSPYWVLTDRLGALQASFQTHIAEYVRDKFDSQVSHIFSKNRKKFHQLSKAIRSRRGTKKEEHFERVDFSMLFKALPIWLVNAADIYNVLPMEQEMFDVLVIDEATQCDIASSIPLMQRAKKTVIVGDPKQLRHVSFISKEKQQQLAENFDVTDVDEVWRDYRNTSILDLFSDALTDQKQVHFLDEHYRSLPQIIQFSNARFYSNAINIMTQAPHAELGNSIQVIHCKGKRTQAGSNRKEAESLFKEIRKVVDMEANLDEHYCQSIGILSPFRGQVDYLLRNLPKYFSMEELDRHRVLIGTPYAFQGEERDIMMLSFSLDNKSHPSAFHYLNREDVFNVAITRARVKQMLFCSMEPDRLSAKNLLGQYLRYSKTNPDIFHKNKNHIYEDKFSQEVKNFIQQRWEPQILYHYPIAGFELDMVIIHNHRTIAIDLVGYPGQFEAAFPVEKYNMLRRIGIEVLVLPYSNWMLQRDNVEKKLEAVLGN